MIIVKMNDCEWFAGPSVRETCEFYANETGRSIDDVMADCPREISQQELDKLQYIVDPDRPEVTLPFRRYLFELEKSGQEFPCFFATTEY